MNKLLDTTVKQLREMLTKYASVSVLNISALIPEFMYYIRFAKWVKQCEEKGYVFTETLASGTQETTMIARAFYNIKLVLNGVKPADIVENDLDFDTNHGVYILTGANRGGKTTLTQAIGLLFVLAQGGIYVPAEEFHFTPVDLIFTHFPADEDQTMDLGRLGEECSRFKQQYTESTEDSLLLLNETFSTTSFEEGYYIAKDAVRAILKKGIRTIYNTHMHKLALDVEALNAEESKLKAASLVMQSKQGNRSFKVLLAPPDGQSYAKDIAEKYGVTYEKLWEA